MVALFSDAGSFGLWPRVVALDHFPELGPVDMGIDLRGTDVGMTQKILNDPQVGAAHEEVGRETVAEFVRVDVLKAGDGGVLPDDLPDRHSFQRAAAEGEHQMTAIPSIIESK